MSTAPAALYDALVAEHLDRAYRIACRLTGEPTDEMLCLVEGQLVDEDVSSTDDGV